MADTDRLRYIIGLPSSPNAAPASHGYGTERRRPSRESSDGHHGDSGFIPYGRRQYGTQIDPIGKSGRVELCGR